MLRTTRLLASALFVISVSVLSTRAGYGGDEINQCGDPAGTPSLCTIQVVGVEMRSACDQFHEWWVQAKNTSFGEYFRVVIHAKVFSGVPNPANQPAVEHCTVENNQTFDLAPGQCASTTSQFANTPVPGQPIPARPCDSQCCQDNQQIPHPPAWENCNTPDEPNPASGCTQILDVDVKVIAWKPSATSEWQLLRSEPAVCGVESSAKCPVINTCSQTDSEGKPNPHYKNWNLSYCNPGL